MSKAKGMTINMNKKISLGAAITFMVVIAGLTFCITMMVSLNYFNGMVFNVKERKEMYTKISEIDSEIRQKYNGTIDEDMMLDAISRGYVSGLGDKYSRYLSKSEYEKQLLDTQGKLVGIGVTIKRDASGYAQVVKVIEGSPAELAGILSGDMITAIDEVDLKTYDFTKVDELIRGNAGTKVKLNIRREGVETLYELARKDIDIKYVTYKLIDKNGYIKINEFNQKTYEQFKNAVDDLIKQGATGLVFDLRDNGGGTLDSATKMLDMLLPQGVIATKTDKSGATSPLATSDKYGVNLPMVTIINGNTASASELFVSALRDFNKATSIGTTTYGKGVMQTLIPLKDGSALSITTASFIPPSGEDFNGVGIKPDNEVKFTPEQEQNFKNGHLELESDTQFVKAVEVLNSKK